jgi:hypothetical protein
MKPFVLWMLVGVGLATILAIAIARAVFPEVVGDGAPAPQAPNATTPFSESEAIEVVATRLGTAPKAERLRQTLRTNGRVTYHSPAHWTVRLNEASWTAHGFGGPSGRYAEPDNEAARLFEHEATGP